MTEMQRIIDAENSDLFDVLAYVAYALPTQTRKQRATTAQVEINFHFDSKQQAFSSICISSRRKGTGNRIGPTRWGGNLDGPTWAGGQKPLLAFPKASRYHCSHSRWSGGGRLRGTDG